MTIERNLTTTLRICAVATAGLLVATLPPAESSISHRSRESATLFAIEITSAPPSAAPGRDATFAFRADQPARFSCVLDGAAAQRCASPISMVGLEPGPHTFVVEATSLLEDVQASDRHAW